MKLPFLASFLVLIGIVFFRIRKSNHDYENEEQSFWEKEHKANAVRKKSLDSLHYITIPDMLLSMDYSGDAASTFVDCINTLTDLSTRKIVNFTGISNTDLKLTYGTANITVLTEYDQNYTTLARTLQKVSEILYDAGLIEDAVSYLEFAVSTGSDVSKTYFLLARIYKDRGEEDKIQGLIQKAEALQSLMKHTIVHTLQESYLSDGLPHSS